MFLAFFSGLVSWCVAIGPRSRGLRKLRPQAELQSQMGQTERFGNGAETKRPPGCYDTFVMSSSLGWKR
jgi:hypothetical protein